MSTIPLALAALLGQTPAPAPDAAPADFRVYVFAAYGAVLAVLFLFTAWTAIQTASAARRLEGLERRLELKEKASKR